MPPRSTPNHSAPKMQKERNPSSRTCSTIRINNRLTRAQPTAHSSRRNNRTPMKNLHRMRSTTPRGTSSTQTQHTPKISQKNNQTWIKASNPLRSSPRRARTIWAPSTDRISKRNHSLRSARFWSCPVCPNSSAREAGWRSDSHILEKIGNLTVLYG